MSVLTFETALPELTSTEAIYRHNDWGEKSGLTLPAFRLMLSWARQNHPAREARNFKHAIKVMIGANAIADEYEAALPHETPIDRLIISAGGLWHDADATEQGSALLFAYHAARMGFSIPAAVDVEAAILTTAEDVQPQTKNEKALSISDLINLGNPDYAAVKARGDEFEAEARAQQGASFDPIAYRATNLQRVSKFITKDLSLGGIELPWHIQTHNNFRHMVYDFATDYDRPVHKVIIELGPAAIQLFDR